MQILIMIFILKIFEEGELYKLIVEQEEHDLLPKQLLQLRNNCLESAEDPLLKNIDIKSDEYYIALILKTFEKLTTEQEKSIFLTTLAKLRFFINTFIFQGQDSPQIQDIIQQYILNKQYELLNYQLTKPLEGEDFRPKLFGYNRPEEATYYDEIIKYLFEGFPDEKSIKEELNKMKRVHLR